MRVMSPRERMVQRSKQVLFIIVAIGMGICIFALAKIQLINDDYYREKAENNQLRDTTISAARGDIYDVNGEILAQSASAYKIYINPSLVASKDDKGNVKVDTETVNIIAKSLSKVLDGVEAEDIIKKYEYTGYQYMVIKSKVEVSEMEAVTTLLKERIGEDKPTFGYYIGKDPDVKRYYPYSNLASSVIGFTGVGDEGRYGLELKYDSTLSGIPGRIITAKNGGSKSGSMPIDYETIYDAQKGTSLVLTIDSTIQKYLEKSLESAYEDTECANALGIIMDVDTGAILAMGSKGFGDYNPNTPNTIFNTKLDPSVSDKYGDEYKEIGEARNGQWKNPCVSDTYEPGSVFKIFTLSAALEEGVADENTTFNCKGSIRVADRNISCHYHAGHGFQTLTQGLMNSCNPFFITVGQALGIDAFYKYFEAFGFTEKTEIDLPSEASPRSGLTYHALDTMTNVNLASTSFGQTFEVSPIQMITAISSIANGGKLMTPYIVAKTLDEDGNVVSETEPMVKRQVISNETAKTVAGMMEQVVSSGTGKNAYIAGYRVAGKTGTSEKVGKTEDGEIKTYWASFGCFAPADDPEIAMLIVIDSPVGQTGGGQVAAPVAREILENVLEYIGVEPQYSEDELDALAKSTPAVTGLTVEAAKNSLKENGFEVKVLGEGKTVLSQIPASGQEIRNGGIVILKTQADIESKTTVPDLSGLTINGAMQKSLANGLNIKISGYSLNTSELLSYNQDIEAGTEAEYGTTITVSFKSNTGVTDQTYSD